MSIEINRTRRRFLGTGAVSVAAAELGMIGAAQAQSNKTNSGRLPTIKPGTNKSFRLLKQIDAGVLNVGYAERGFIQAKRRAMASRPCLLLTSSI